MEKSFSVSRKASIEERDSVEVACNVRQAIQRENTPVQNDEVLSHDKVCLTVLIILSSSLN